RQAQKHPVDSGLETKDQDPQKNREAIFGDQRSVRSFQISGNSTTSSILRRYPTQLVPPVPRLKPMMRSTVVTWRKRQRRNASSTSVSSSPSWYRSQCLFGSRYTASHACSTSSLGAYGCVQSRSRYVGGIAKPRRASSRSDSSYSDGARC